MKTLKEHTLIYDDECPMCKMYSAAFVKTGMVDPDGTQAYTSAVKRDIPNINWQRACNEIALVDHKNNTVLYGVDSLAAILTNNSPLLKWLLKSCAIRYLMNRLYFFISYNRKVIIPGSSFEGLNTCTPTLNYKYRWVYIIVTWLFTSAVVTYYSRLLVPFIPETDFAREFLVCGGPLVFQGVVVAFIQRDRVIHYLGNMMTISFAGALLLTPPLLLSGVIVHKLFYLLWFFGVIGLMFMEHVRRLKILSLPWTVSASWVLYRILVLIIIL